jgi:broad specificity phosphatase PhoE
MRLLLVRHAQTTWNSDGRVQGSYDAPLSELGERQSSRVAARLSREPLEAAYASTLQRTWRTAEIALAGRGLPVTRDPAWCEAAYGEWEGRTWGEIQALDPARAARRRADPANVAPPGGESFLDLQRRIVARIEGLRRRHDDGVVLVVTHGGPLRVLAAWCMGHDPNQAWRFKADNAALSAVHWTTQGPVLELWNETAHLHEG